MIRPVRGFVRLATSLVLASAAAAQDPPIPAPGTEEYELARAEAVVELLKNDETDPNLQYRASPFLVTFLQQRGAEGLSEEAREQTAAFIRTALEGLRVPSGEEAPRIRGGIAVRLVPWFADEVVRDLLYETLELNFDQVAWRPEFFDALRTVGLTEALPHFRAVVDEFAALPPSEYRTARYPYPIREAFACLAVLGGDEEAPRLSAYLRPGVPESIRGPALTALGVMNGPRAFGLLREFAGDELEFAGATRVERLACGEAFAAHDDPRAARVFLDLLHESEGPRAWAALRGISGRPLPTLDVATAWVEELGDTSLRASRLAAIEESGYAIGDLGTPEERAALIAAATDDERTLRRAAFDELVRILGTDPSHGRFWVFRAERRGIEVDVVVRPGEPLSDEDDLLLRRSQARHLERLRE